jgi:LTXXQ motif family protein
MDGGAIATAQAVQIVQPALAEFYSLLSDEQKTKLTALGTNQNRNNETTGSLVQTCAAPPVGVTNWPTSEIDQAVHPTDAQRTRLLVLKQAGDRAAELLKASCPTDEPLTPPARLEAVAKRLDAMLQAVKLVRAELNSFYDSLSDEQKAQFDAIGPQRAARG